MCSVEYSRFNGFDSFTYNTVLFLVLFFVDNGVFLLILLYHKMLLVTMTVVGLGGISKARYS